MLIQSLCDPKRYRDEDDFLFDCLTKRSTFLATPDDQPELLTGLAQDLPTIVPTDAESQS